MEKININDPICLTLAADNRFTDPDYTNDHIWDLVFKNREPETIILETSFGLRAKWIRLFPNFIYENRSIINIKDYYQPPAITAYYPNYMCLEYSPIKELAVKTEYWVPESHVVSGRFNFHNISKEKIDFIFDWICLLNPLDIGNSMGIMQYGTNVVLEGKTQRLSPVCMITSGISSHSSPYPALSNKLHIPSGDKSQVIWALASKNNREESFSIARKYIGYKFDPEIAKIKIQNKNTLLDITTNDNNINIVLSMMQKYALNSFFPGSINLPDPSFVISRQSDQGYSYRGDGSDYPPSWSGQTALDVYYLTNILLPGEVSYCKGLINNFIYRAKENGYIDNKPGLAGQAQSLLCQPVLASTALLIADHSGDAEWLHIIFPPLIKYINLWFEPDQDKDCDGFPEWSHPMQTGFDDIQSFEDSHSILLPDNINFIESPLLGFFLVKELSSLIKICKILKNDNEIDWLINKKEKLLAEIEKCWHQNSLSYNNRDYLTHDMNQGYIIYKGKGVGEFKVNKEFEKPQRVQLTIIPDDNNYRKLDVKITGYYKKRKTIERISNKNIVWKTTSAFLTPTKLFSSIEKIEISGTKEIDEFILYKIDYSSYVLTQFLSLWAEIPDNKRAKQIIENNLLINYLTDYGLSTFSKQINDQLPGRTTVDVVLNMLVCQGLQKYGYQKEANDIYHRILNVLISDLKNTNSFHDKYFIKDGSPSGSKNNIRGLIPASFFLELIGIDIHNENEIIIHNDIPQEGTVTVKYKGITINKHKNDSVVYHQSGQSIKIQEKDTKLIHISEPER